MKITVGGTAGSGKGTLARILSEELGLEKLSVGGYRRKKAEELGVTIQEYNEMGTEDPGIERQTDGWQGKLGEEKDNFVIDGRLSFHFIPDSIKILLDADPRERAERIYGQGRKKEKYESKDEALKKVLERDEKDRERYEKIYGINPFDPKHFDIAIDTTGFEDEDLGREALRILKSKNLIR